MILLKIKNPSVGLLNIGKEESKGNDVLQKTSYAASTDESRPILNGTLLSFKDEKLTTVCTDGRRLALIEQEIDMPEDSSLEVVLPIKTVSELIKSLGNEGDVNIKMSTSQIAFEFDNILDAALKSNILDASIPVAISANLKDIP